MFRQLTKKVADKLRATAKFSTTASKGGKVKKIVQVGVLTSALFGTAIVVSGYSPANAEESRKQRPKLVILGTGWGSISLLKEIGDDYDISVVSPRNYFLFTPLLPSVTVGTLEPRSVVEPIRKYCRRKGKLGQVKFYEAECTSVDIKNQKIKCVDVSQIKAGEGSFELPYDTLVVAVGAVSNTFNTPGVLENANFLKSIEDVQAIRTRVMDCFESANYPGLTDEDKRRLLSFVIVGGGPTGVEFAAELHDFLREDLVKYFPELLPYTKISLIQSGDHILNTYDKKISEIAEKQFKRESIDIQINSRVKEVTPTDVVVQDAKTKEIRKLPFGVCVWSTGITQAPLARNIADQIPNQMHEKALVTDQFLKVLGTENVYAVGDCATVEQKKLQSKLTDLFELADSNKDGVLSDSELETLFTEIVKEYPQLQFYSSKFTQLVKDYDSDKDGVLSLAEFKELLRVADSKVKSLPSTAQVANQQGKYLGKALNDVAGQKPAAPFVYQHFGSFAYVGGRNSVADLPSMKIGGFGAWWLWRSAYIFNQHSLRNRYLVGSDWLKTIIFGRDISRF
jgi:NADH:ubiquinone reductase (non-electrogenic)